MWCAHAHPPIQVVGSYRRPEEFLAQPNPVDVLLLDPQIDNLRPNYDALRHLCVAGQRVVVYTKLSADEIILRCLDFGALGFIVKSEGKRHLIDAIHAAAAAEPYVGPRMASALANDRAFGRIKLSQREKEVLVAWFQTESKEIVAERLFIAPTTVRTYLQRARAKYAAVGRPAPTKSALLARAVEDGILSLAELYPPGGVSAEG